MRAVRFGRFYPELEDYGLPAARIRAVRRGLWLEYVQDPAQAARIPPRDPATSLGRETTSVRSLPLDKFVVRAEVALGAELTLFAHLCLRAKNQIGHID